MTYKELIQRYLNWDQQSIEVLMEKYLQDIFNVSYRFCSNKNDTNDLAQEICYKIIKNIHKFNFESQFKTWIYKISYNEWLNFVWKFKKEINNKSLEISDDFDIEDTNINILENIEQSFASDIITKQIDQLNPLDKNILLMFYYDNISIKEIAQTLWQTESNIKVRLHRTKKFLKNKLSENGIIN